jgi:single-strand DNA-binding protein
VSNLNKVLLIGRLTRDPELRYTPQGTAVVDIGLAINREYTAGTERRKETTFVDVTLWARQAEVVSQYMRKGSPIFIEGRLSLDSWEQDGQKRSKLRVVAENFQFIGTRSEGEGGGQDYPARGRGRSEEATTAPSASPRYSAHPRAVASQDPAGAGSPTTLPAGEGEGSLGIDESEIPF